MRIFFGAIIFALSVAAISGAVLAWDGSFQFLSALASQSPYIPHNRLMVLFPQGLLLLISQVTHSFIVLQSLFGLVYVAITVTSLYVSWLILRERAPWLFIWVAFGLGLGTLPGQFPMYSEATLVVHLFWPLFLIMLLYAPEEYIVLAVVLSGAIFFLHPFAAALFGLLAIQSYALGLLRKEQRYRIWLWSFLFVMLTATSVVRFALARTGYETEQISLTVIRDTFALAVYGLPLWALGLGYLAALFTFAAGVIDAKRNQTLVYACHAMTASAIVASGALLLVWASDALLWRYALGFRTWTLFVSLPFLGLAMVEGLRSVDRDQWHRRLRSVQAIALVFLAVIFAQSIVWAGITNRLRAFIAASSTSCISASSIEWLIDTPLYHPSVTTYSLVIQGDAPSKVVLFENSCEDLGTQNGVPVGNWGEIPWQSTWFDLSKLAGRVKRERAVLP